MALVVSRSKDPDVRSAEASCKSAVWLILMEIKWWSVDSSLSYLSNHAVLPIQIKWMPTKWIPLNYKISRTICTHGRQTVNSHDLQESEPSAAIFFERGSSGVQVFRVLTLVPALFSFWSDQESECPANGGRPYSLPSPSKIKQAMYKMNSVLRLLALAILLKQRCPFKVLQ